MSSSIQRELNRFFSKLSNTEYNIQAVTKGALTQARAKLKPSAFSELNQVAVEEFYDEAPYTVWKGHRLLAADSSSVHLPSHSTIIEIFGEYGAGSKADKPCSMARISLCYDVLNLITLDARIDRWTESEQTLLKEHLATVNFRKNDLLLLDRGYPSIALMYELQQRGVDFCIRMRDDWWNAVKEFVRQDRSNKSVVFELPKKDHHLLQQWPAVKPVVHCRLVSVQLDSGEKEILCTSLLDENLYTQADVKELYHYRWNVEEAYKLYKCRIGLAEFSGKTALAVQQDFFAKVFMMSMCAILSHPIETKVRQECAEPTRKYKRQINRTNALAFCRDAWVQLWRDGKKQKFLQALDDLLFKTTDIVRPNRKFERKKHRKYPPPPTYKRL